jgi:Desulfoferrodoxin, N-terminal domain
MTSPITSTDAVKPGARYRCASCGTEVVVIKADGAVPQCCDAAMQVVGK